MCRRMGRLPISTIGFGRRIVSSQLQRRGDQRRHAADGQRRDRHRVAEHDARERQHAAGPLAERRQPATVTDRVAAFGTARVRGGIAMDRVQLYLTGGGAYVTRNVATSAASVSVQRTGLVGGAGVEGSSPPVASEN